MGVTYSVPNEIVRPDAVHIYMPGHPSYDGLDRSDAFEYWVTRDPADETVSSSGGHTKSTFATGASGVDPLTGYIKRSGVSRSNKNTILMLPDDLRCEYGVRCGRSAGKLDAVVDASGVSWPVPDFSPTGYAWRNIRWDWNGHQVYSQINDTNGPTSTTITADLISTAINITGNATEGGTVITSVSPTPQATWVNMPFAATSTITPGATISAVNASAHTVTVTNGTLHATTGGTFTIDPTTSLRNISPAPDPTWADPNDPEFPYKVSGTNGGAALFTKTSAQFVSVDVTNNAAQLKSSAGLVAQTVTGATIAVNLGPSDPWRNTLIQLDFNSPGSWVVSGGTASITINSGVLKSKDTTVDSSWVGLQLSPSSIMVDQFGVTNEAGYITSVNTSTNEFTVSNLTAKVTKPSQAYGIVRPRCITTDIDIPNFAIQMGNTHNDDSEYTDREPWHGIQMRACANIAMTGTATHIWSDHINTGIQGDPNLPNWGYQPENISVLINGNGNGRHALCLQGQIGFSTVTGTTFSDIQRWVCDMEPVARSYRNIDTAISGLRNLHQGTSGGAFVAMQQNTVFFGEPIVDVPNCTFASFTAEDGLTRGLLTHPPMTFTTDDCGADLTSGSDLPARCFLRRRLTETTSEMNAAPTTPRTNVTVRRGWQRQQRNFTIHDVETVNHDLGILGKSVQQQDKLYFTADTIAATLVLKDLTYAIGSPHVSSAKTPFVSTDVGRAVTVDADGAFPLGTTTILSVASGVATMSVNAAANSAAGGKGAISWGANPDGGHKLYNVAIIGSGESFGGAGTQAEFVVTQATRLDGVTDPSLLNGMDIFAGLPSSRLTGGKTLTWHSGDGSYTIAGTTNFTVTGQIFTVLWDDIRWDGFTVTENRNAGSNLWNGWQNGEYSSQPAPMFMIPQLFDHVTVERNFCLAHTKNSDGITPNANMLGYWYNPGAKGRDWLTYGAPGGSTGWNVGTMNCFPLALDDEHEPTTTTTCAITADDLTLSAPTFTVTTTASDSSHIPYGVTMYLDGSAQDVAPLVAGVATYTAEPQSGTHTWQAKWAGNPDYLPSVSSTLTQTVGSPPPPPNPTTVTVSHTGDPLTFGDPTTVTVAPNPVEAGTITLADNGTIINVWSFGDGASLSTFTYTPAAGTRTLVATYIPTSSSYLQSSDAESFDVTVFVDSTPPTIVTVDPVNDEVNVDPGAPVVVTFSEPVDDQTFVIDLSGTTVQDVVWNSDFTQATVTHQRFNYGASVAPTVDVSDLSGNALVATPNWTFTIKILQVSKLFIGV